MSEFALYNADCREAFPTLSGIDAVVTDPPYGIGNDPDYTRFTHDNRWSTGQVHNGIDGDDRGVRFDPSHLIARFDKLVIWGAPYFSVAPPLGSTLIWVKKPDAMIGEFLSDAEIAWSSKGHGVHVNQIAWMGAYREVEQTTRRAHPNQKPIALMLWCLEFLGLSAGATVCDPYMGSGTTGVACAQRGINFVGIESDPTHFAGAERRVRNAYGDICPTLDDDKRGQLTLW